VASNTAGDCREEQAKKTRRGDRVFYAQLGQFWDMQGFVTLAKALHFTRLFDLSIQPIRPPLHHFYSRFHIRSMVVDTTGSLAVYVSQLRFYSVAVPVLLIKHRAELVPEPMA